MATKKFKCACGTTVSKTGKDAKKILKPKKKGKK
tara:strand:+ start:288 stop:389 length:102 start_codon:yes stop_codon:yes gene_type:complete